MKLFQLHTNGLALYRQTRFICLLLACLIAFAIGRLCLFETDMGYIGLNEYL